MLGPADFNLGFAGRNDPAWIEKTAASLRGIRSGDRLQWTHHPDCVLLKAGDGAVAMLSRSAAQLFCERAERIEEIRVLGVYVWRKEDSTPEWRNTCAVDRWGVPLCEVVLRSAQDCMK